MAKTTNNDEPTVGDKDIVIECPTMLWKLLDSTNARYGLGYPHFKPITNKRGRWEVTNARAAAVVHVDGDFDKTADEYVVPPEVMPKKVKLTTVRLTDGSWTATGPSGASDSTVVANPSADEAGRFPDIYPSVFPDSFTEHTDRKGKTHSCAQVTLDARLLLSLAEALNPQGESQKVVTLAVHGCGDEVVAVTGSCGIGVIMPMSGRDPEERASAYKTGLVESAKHQSLRPEPVMFVPQASYEAYLQWKSMSGNSFALLAKAGALITTLQESISSETLANDCEELLDEIADVVGELPIVNEVCETIKKKKKKTTTKGVKEPVPATVPEDAADEDYMDYE